MKTESQPFVVVRHDAELRTIVPYQYFAGASADASLRTWSDQASEARIFPTWRRAHNVAKNVGGLTSPAKYHAGAVA